MKQPLPFSPEALLIKKGTYQHYKGNTYEVFSIGRLEETLEEVVVYYSYDRTVWVRTVKDFLSKVTLPDGRIVQRFSKVPEVKQ